ncbi:MAG TPA: response regulator [Methylomirabilota bacterium]
MTEPKVVRGARRRVSHALLGFSARARVNYGIGFAVLLIFGIGWLEYRTTAALEKITRRAAASHDVLGHLGELHAHLRDVEAAHLRYLLSGDDRHLPPYTTARELVTEDVAALRKGLAADREFPRRLDVLEPLIQTRFAEFDEAAVSRRQGALDTAARAATGDKGLEGRDRLRKQLDEMRAAEQEALDEALLERAARARDVRLVIAGASGCALLVVGLAALALNLQITGRERVQRAGAGAARRLDAVLGVSEELLRSHELTAVLQIIARRAAGLMEPASAAIYVWDEAAGMLVPRAWFGFGEWMGRTRYRLGEGLPGSVAQRRRGLMLDDYRRSPLADPAVVRLTRVTSALVEPILHDDRLLGVLAVHQEVTPRPITRQHRLLTGFFVTQAAMAIDNARLAESLANVRAAVADRTALAGVAGAARDADTTESLRRMCREVARCAGADMVVAFVRARDGEPMRPVAGYHVPKPALERLEPAAIELTGTEPWSEIVNGGDVAWTPDVKAEEGFAGSGLQPLAHRAAAVVPIPGDRELDGLLYLTWWEQACHLDEGRLVTLRAVGRAAAVVVRTSRLAGALDTAAARLDLVTGIAQHLAAATDPELALKALVRGAGQLTGAPVVSVWQVDEARRTLELGAFIDQVTGASAPTRELRFGEGPVGWVAEHREILGADDVASDARFTGDPWVERRNLPSFLALPIVSAESLVAVIVLQGQRPLRVGPSELKILQCLGAQAMLAARAAATAALPVAADEAAADASARAHGEFLGSLAHELRTPLNSVVGFCRVLLKNRGGNLQEKDLTYLRRIQENGKRLLGLVDAALALARLEKASPTVAPVTIDTVVAGALEAIATDIGEGEELRVVAEVPSPVAPIHTDAAKLQHALVHLISLARKSGGNVTVRVEVHETDARPLRIDILDDGGEGAEEWSGLGLTLSRSLLDLLGFHLEVRHEAGPTPAFRILLAGGRPALHPAAGPRSLPEAGAMATPEGLDLVAFSGQLVLVIDHKSKTRARLKRYFEKFGCTVITSSSGKRGLNLAQRHRPQLITVDPELPKMNGWEVAQAIKEDAALKETPVVVVSGDAVDTRRPLAGAVDVVERPVTREGLSKALKGRVDGHRSRVLVVEDDEDVRTLITNYLAGEASEVKTVANGREALSALETFTPDLIILDLLMPVLDGLTFLAMLRRHPRHAAVPVVVVTVKDLSTREASWLGEETITVLRKDETLEDELRQVLHGIVEHKRLPAVERFPSPP